MTIYHRPTLGETQQDEEQLAPPLTVERRGMRRRRGDSGDIESSSDDDIVIRRARPPPQQATAESSSDDNIVIRRVRQPHQQVAESSSDDNIVIRRARPAREIAPNIYQVRPSTYTLTQNRGGLKLNDVLVFLQNFYAFVIILILGLLLYRRLPERRHTSNALMVVSMTCTSQMISKIWSMQQRNRSAGSGRISGRSVSMMHQSIPGFDP